MRFYLSIYGIDVEVLALQLDQAAILESLGRDFDYFKAEQPAGEIKIRLELKAAEFDIKAEQPGPRLFKTKMCDVHGWGPKRFCNYGHGVWVKTVNNPACRSFTVFGADSDLAYEASYVALLSAIGEELDCHGYHRLHSVGIQAHGTAFALYADSGLGKSATAILFSQDPSARVFSDEMPLIKDGVIYPFPIRMALHPHIANSLGLNVSGARQFKRKIYPTKALFEIPREAVAQPADLNVLLIGTSGALSQIKPLQAQDQAKFILAFVLGLGLPQMAEHMLRAGNFLSLLKIAVSRLKTALTLLGFGKSSIRAQKLILSKNARENIQTISKTFS